MITRISVMHLIPKLSVEGEIKNNTPVFLLCTSICVSKRNLDSVLTT